MRFRIWYKNEKRFLTESDNFYVGLDGKLWSGLPNNKSIDENEYVIQYSTKINDKNGTEIYEGDVVKYTVIDPMEDSLCTWTDIILRNEIGFTEFPFQYEWATIEIIDNMLNINSETF